MKKYLLGTCLCFISVATIAQTPAATEAQVPQAAVILPAQAVNVLRAGAEIPMITREELTTKKKQVRVGQRVQIEVAANITQNGIIVIPIGTPGVAEITEVRNKGMWGKSGYIAGRIISLRLGDRQIRLSGTFDDKGVTGTGGVVAAVAFLPVAGFFTTGTSAMIPMGAPVKAFLDEDIAFQTVAVTPQILQVPAPQVPTPQVPAPQVPARVDPAGAPPTAPSGK